MTKQKAGYGGKFEIEFHHLDDHNYQSHQVASLGSVAKWIRSKGTGTIKKISRVNGSKLNFKEMLEVMEKLR